MTLINRLPTRTWNRLGVNETALSWDENGTTEMSPLTVDVTGRKKVVRVEVNGENEFSRKKVTINAQSETSVTVIEVLSTENNLAVETELNVKENALVRLIQVQRSEEKSLVYNKVTSFCDESGRVELLQVFPGKGDIYSDSLIELTGDKSSFKSDIGYRVKSYRGVQFRIWATQILKEYLVKGFVMNNELLKRAGGGNYFDELLSRIRDIRSSEKIFYRKILEIYALSIDYDPSTESTRLFFATVQNKMHFSVHGHTAAEVIYGRADAGKDFMGLTNWTGAVPKRNDIEYAKNYLTDDELDTLNRIVSLYLDFAELQAKSHTPMYMKDWIQKLDDFLRLSGKELLQHAGTISAELAKEKANFEYDEFKKRISNQLSPVEIDFIENFEKEQKKLRGK